MRTFFFFLLILSAGCRHTDLENALRQAGENRSQLEQVLDHYRNDSLKYKAACFLIANMPGHYSYGGEVLDAYYFSVDSLFRIGAPCEQTNRQIDELAQNLQISRYAKIIEDVKTTTGKTKKSTSMSISNIFVNTCCLTVSPTSPWNIGGTCYRANTAK